MDNKDDFEIVFSRKLEIEEGTKRVLKIAKRQLSDNRTEFILIDVDHRVPHPSRKTFIEAYEEFISEYNWRKHLLCPLMPYEEKDFNYLVKQNIYLLETIEEEYSNIYCNKIRNLKIAKKYNKLTKDAKRREHFAHHR